ncbi:hypothetical protein IWZ03DRAFT_383646 [Phyllosticta citriasiana]|uniref:Uncharacterized protein n=1 Tax=Phyllosticta citriasiana TaxID=595635 RepID=A0ABR1KG47_9PEZI
MMMKTHTTLPLLLLSLFLTYTATLVAAEQCAIHGRHMKVDDASTHACTCNVCRLAYGDPFCPNVMGTVCCDLTMSMHQDPVGTFRTECESCAKGAYVADCVPPGPECKPSVCKDG